MWKWSRRGLTLIELMVALFILSLVVAGAFALYISNLKIYKSEAKTAETQMGKIMALELLRRDIVHAGYGLPWDVSGISYQEATEDEADDYNDAPNPPRAFILEDNVKIDTEDEADYLVIKSIKAAENEATRKWGTLSHSGTSWKFEPRGEEGNFSEDDYVIFIGGIDKEIITRQLHENGGNWYWSGNDTDYDNTIGLDPDTLYLVYGVSTRVSTNGTGPRMPFNRVDYYLDRPDDGLPDKCNPSTYILYRATIKHADGTRDPQPILDCVKDFQVAFGLDTDGDGEIDLRSSALPSTPENVRDQVKEVRVFILYQEGQRLEHEASTTSITLGDDQTGPLSTFTPTGEDRHYRWKVLKLVVRPLNMGV